MKKNNSYLSNSFKKIAGLFQKNLFLRNLKNIYYYVDAILLIFAGKCKKQKSEKKEVLIIYNIALGDGVIWRCAAVHLRKIYPAENYKLTLLCQKGLNKIYENDGIFDNIISIDFNKSTVNLKERLKNYKILRKKYYDLIIDPVGIMEWTTNIFYTRASLGIKKVGVIDTTSKCYCKRKDLEKIYDELIEINEPKLSLLQFYQCILNELANNKFDIKVGFEKLKVIPSKIKLPKKYFIVFPAASMKLKRWNIDKYAILAKKIYDKTKMELVLLGTGSDKEAIEEFKNKLEIPYVDLFDKTNLNDYIDIIDKAKLVVTNDTSAYHIALIEQTPVAIITGGYTYNRYVLYHFDREKEFQRPCIIVYNMDCFDCNNRCKYLKNDDTNWPCLEKITVEYAWKKIEKLIEENKIGE